MQTTLSTRDNQVVEEIKYLFEQLPSKPLFVLNLLRFVQRDISSASFLKACSEISGSLSLTVRCMILILTVSYTSNRHLVLEENLDKLTVVFEDCINSTNRLINRRDQGDRR